MMVVPEMLAGVVVVASLAGSNKLLAFGFIERSGLHVGAMRFEGSGESPHREG